MTCSATSAVSDIHEAAFRKCLILSKTIAGMRPKLLVPHSERRAILWARLAAIVQAGRGHVRSELCNCERTLASISWPIWMCHHQM